MLRELRWPRTVFAPMALLLSAFAPAAVQAQVLYSDTFDSAAASANYNVFVTAGATGPSGDATFGYNYGAATASGGLAIPEAPHSPTGGGAVATTGLRVRTDNLQTSVGTVVGATSVVTKGLTLTAPYTVQVDVWSNYIGGTSIAASGSNGSTGVAVGIGSAGTSLQYIAGNDGHLVEAFGDNGGGANGAYRVYTNNVSPRPTPANSPYYAAGTGANSATFSDPYYKLPFPSVSAPADQITLSAATQGGSTPAGVQGFAWHTWTITDDGTSTHWYIDHSLITAVPDSAWTAGGSQVSLGNDDTGLTGNSAALNQQLNAQIFDNLIITSGVPEPGSLSLLGLAGAGLLIRRRRRKA